MAHFSSCCSSPLPSTHHCRLAILFTMLIVSTFTTATAAPANPSVSNSYLNPHKNFTQKLRKTADWSDCMYHCLGYDFHLGQASRIEYTIFHQDRTPADIDNLFVIDVPSYLSLDAVLCDLLSSNEKEPSKGILHPNAAQGAGADAGRHVGASGRPTCSPTAADRKRYRLGLEPRHYMEVKYNRCRIERCDNAFFASRARETQVARNVPARSSSAIGY